MLNCLAINVVVSNNLHTLLLKQIFADRDGFQNISSVKYTLNTFLEGVSVEFFPEKQEICNNFLFISSVELV